MAYMNSTDLDQKYGLIPGDSVPVELKTWPEPIRNGFIQFPRIEGNLKDTPYSIAPNSQPISIDFGGNGMANMPGFNIFNPIATTFNTVIINEGGGGGDTGDVDSVRVANDGTDNSGQYLTLGGTDDDPIVTFNPNNIPAASNSFGQLLADTGGSQVAGSVGANFSITTADDFISSTTGSDGNGPKIELAFTKNLYTTFSTGGNGTCTPGSLTADLGIEGINGVITAGNNTKIDVALDDETAPSEWYAYGTVQATSSPLSGGNTVTNFNAESVGDTLGILNGGAAQSDTGIDPDISKSIVQLKESSGKLNIEVNPLSYAGFGAQLVKITGPSGPTVPTNSIEGMDAARYTCEAYTFSGKTGSSEGAFVPLLGKAVVSGTLYDFAINKDRTTEELIKDSPGGTTTAPLRWPINTVLLAQRVADSIYVTSHMPRLEVDCDGS